jgi:class 3 adenylate cyclase
MKNILTLLFLSVSLFAFAQQQSIEDLKKELQQASDSKTKMFLNYQLSEAYLRSNIRDNEELAIDYGKRAFNLAKQVGNNGMAARSAYQVGQSYVSDNNDRSAKSWYDTALAFAKRAGDSDLIIKSVEKRSKIETSDRDYREAYHIVEEAFKYFSGKGTSISDLESKYEQEKRKLASEKQLLEAERQRLQTDIDNLVSERDVLSTDKTRLEQRQRELVQEKAQVEEAISEKEEKLATVEEAREKAEEAAQSKAKEVKKLSREKLEQEAVLQTKEAELATARLISERAENQRKMLLILAGFGVLFALFLLVLFISARRSRSRLADKNKIIKQEQERSDELLLNILPQPIAEELKQYGKAQPKKYEQVTVLFSDFKNFTKISEQLSPEELVAELDKCFKAFDFIISQYSDIEKIKTIGDAYMCASGLADRRTIPYNLVRAALEMQEFLDEQKREKMRLGKPYFEARIGIHTGSVVAGVVGVNKFAYDIWGDTVNIAARMEANGQEGRVNISSVTHGLIKYKFECEYRGKVQAKNKGLIDMYFVKHELQSAGVPA